MFGIFKPCFKRTTATDKADYSSIYCNLCANLSLTYGLKSRPLVVNDIVTLDWLLGTSGSGDRQFPSINCLKGGITPYHKHELSDHQKLLTALSAFTIGTKIADDVADSPSVRTRFVSRQYSRIFEKSESDLKNLAFPVNRMHALLERQKEIEGRKVGCLDSSSQATAEAFGLVAGSLASAESTEKAAVIGEFVGRCVYLFDALRDIKTDRKNNSYNPFLNDKWLLANPGELLNCFLADQKVKLDSLLKQAVLHGNFLRRWDHMLQKLGRMFRASPEGKLYSSYCCFPCGPGTFVCDCEDCGTCCACCVMISCCSQCITCCN